ncbi:8521_t:CDS:2, partial [Entrophospora sp. SA101]
NLEYYQRFTLASDIFQGIREEPIPNTPDEYINLYKACWQDDPENRPDIQYVETLLEKISGSNIVDIVDKEENNEQQKNEDNSSLSHPNINLIEPSNDTLETKFDNLDLIEPSNDTLETKFDNLGCLK